MILFCFGLVETRSFSSLGWHWIHYGSQAELHFPVLLPPECWDCWHALNTGILWWAHGYSCGRWLNYWDRVSFCGSAGSYYVVQASLKFMAALLPQLPKCLCYRCVLAHCRQCAWFLFLLWWAEVCYIIEWNLSTLSFKICAFCILFMIPLTFQISKSLTSYL